MFKVSPRYFAIPSPAQFGKAGSMAGLAAIISGLCYNTFRKEPALLVSDSSLTPKTDASEILEEKPVSQDLTGSQLLAIFVGSFAAGFGALYAGKKLYQSVK